MIKYEIGAGKMKAFDVAGDTIAISAEISFLISQIYVRTKAINPDAARGFKSLMQRGLMDGSPVWSLDASDVDGITIVIPKKRLRENEIVFNLNTK